jgi:excisionase family DNA binding protein
MGLAANNPTKRALRIKAAAAYLSVSPHTIRSLVQRGELPIIRICDGERSPFLIDVRDLDSLVERKKTTL